MLSPSFSCLPTSLPYLPFMSLPLHRFSDKHHCPLQLPSASSSPTHFANELIKLLSCTLYWEHGC